MTERLRPLWLLLLWLAAGEAAAHALQPGYLSLEPAGEGEYRVLWKKPAVRGRPMAIDAVLPAGCQPRRAPQSLWDGSGFVARWRTRCADGLAGGEIRVAGLERTVTDVLLRVSFPDGGTLTHRLDPDRTAFTVPAAPTLLEVVKSYLLLGIRHILGGVDHLLFVLALLLLVDGVRRLVWTVTAFTAAHSLTLAAATLGWVRVPGPPVEAVIALSIVFVAAEILHARQGRPGLTARQPWLVAFVFGLLHGFGFAGALAEVGLPAQAIPAALLFFNLGVEAGQLLFIGAVLAALAAARRGLPAVPGARRFGALPAYGIGGMGAFWLIERLAAFA